MHVNRREASIQAPRGNKPHARAQGPCQQLLLTLLEQAAAKGTPSDKCLRRVEPSPPLRQLRGLASQREELRKSVWRPAGGNAPGPPQSGRSLARGKSLSGATFLQETRCVCICKDYVYPTTNRPDGATTADRQVGILWECSNCLHHMILTDIASHTLLPYRTEGG